MLTSSNDHICCSKGITIKQSVDLLQKNFRLVDIVDTCCTTCLPLEKDGDKRKKHKKMARFKVAACVIILRFFLFFYPRL